MPAASPDHRHSAELLTPHLRTAWLGRTLHLLDATDSTNTEIQRLSGGRAPHGTVVWADRQTAGRGRRGRQWFSAPGTSLCVSLLLRPPGEALRDRSWLPWVPLAAALGLAAGITRGSALQAHLKWPNDLLFGAEKVGGLLCENLPASGQSPALIVGFGLNVNSPRQDFPPELQSLSTSLAEQAGRPLDRHRLLADILNELEPRLDAASRADLASLRAAYRHSCTTLGKRVRVDLAESRSVEGTALDIADSGALLVQPDALPDSPTPEVVEVLAGDVVHLR